MYWRASLTAARSVLASRVPLRKLLLFDAVHVITPLPSFGTFYVRSQILSIPASWRRASWQSSGELPGNSRGGVEHPLEVVREGGAPDCKGYVFRDWYGVQSGEDRGDIILDIPATTEGVGHRDAYHRLSR
jgi:hypothetical protein